MSKPAPDVVANVESQIAEYEAVAAGMRAGLECMRGGPSPWASEDDMAADIAEMLQAMPEFAAAVAGAPKKRSREAPLTDAVMRAASVLHPDGIPTKAALPNSRLCGEIRAYLLQQRLVAANNKGDVAIHDDTILIALGRKKPRKRRTRNQ